MIEPPETFLGERRREVSLLMPSWVYKFEYFNLYVTQAMDGFMVGTKPVRENGLTRSVDGSNLIETMCACARSAMVPHRIKHQEALKKMQREMAYFAKLKSELDSLQGVNVAPTFWERLG